MRTFEFRDAKSAKFWSIELQGKSFTVRFGKIGTAGQTQTKEFADAAKAQKEHDKLIAEKASKGYIEVGAADVPAPPSALEAKPAKPAKASTKKAKQPSVATPPADDPPAPAHSTGPVSTLSPGHHGLLAAVRQDPDDDTVRLVLADWLEEQGESDRAEFIRVWVELARRGMFKEDDPRRHHGVELSNWDKNSLRTFLRSLSAENKALVERGWELLDDHRADWLAGCPLENQSPFGFHFERGMACLILQIYPDHLIGPEELQEEMNKLAALDALARQPVFAWLAEVKLHIDGGGFGRATGEGQDWEALFTHPALRHVTCIELVGLIGGGEPLDLSQLATRRDLGRLTALSFMNYLGDNVPVTVEADDLWESLALSNLRRLEFAGPYFKESDYLPVVQSSHLTRLRSLRIDMQSAVDDCSDWSGDGDKVLRALAESPHFPGLQEVYLNRTHWHFHYYPESVLALLRSSLLPSLEFVEFDFAEIDEDDWRAWAEAKADALPAHAAGLVRELTAIAAACQRGHKVRRVRCGLDLLLFSPGMGVSRDKDRLGYLGCPRLSPAPLPTDLSNTGLGDVVLSAISASPHLAQLTEPEGGDKSKKSKSRKKSPARLVELNLSGNTFGDEGALALADSPHAAGLHRLNVSGNRLSGAALARLRQRFPEVVFDV